MRSENRGRGFDDTTSSKPYMQSLQEAIEAELASQQGDGGRRGAGNSKTWRGLKPGVLGQLARCVNFGHKRPGYLLVQAINRPASPPLAAWNRSAGATFPTG